MHLLTFKDKTNTLYSSDSCIFPCVVVLPANHCCSRPCLSVRCKRASDMADQKTKKTSFVEEGARLASGFPLVAMDEALHKKMKRQMEAAAYNQEPLKKTYAAVAASLAALRTKMLTLNPRSVVDDAESARIELDVNAVISLLSQFDALVHIAPCKSAVEQARLGVAAEQETIRSDVHLLGIVTTRDKSLMRNSDEGRLLGGRDVYGAQSPSDQTLEQKTLYALLQLSEASQHHMEHSAVSLQRARYDNSEWLRTRPEQVHPPTPELAKAKEALKAIRKSADPPFLAFLRHLGTYQPETPYDVEALTKLLSGRRGRAKSASPASRDATRRRPRAKSVPRATVIKSLDVIKNMFSKALQYAYESPDAAADSKASIQRQLSEMTDVVVQVKTERRVYIPSETAAKAVAIVAEIGRMVEAKQSLSETVRDDSVRVQFNEWCKEVCATLKSAQTTQASSGAEMIDAAGRSAFGSSFQSEKVVSVATAATYPATSIAASGSKTLQPKKLDEKARDVSVPDTKTKASLSADKTLWDARRVQAGLGANPGLSSDPVLLMSPQPWRSAKDIGTGAGSWQNQPKYTADTKSMKLWSTAESAAPWKSTQASPSVAAATSAIYVRVAGKFVPAGESVLFSDKKAAVSFVDVADLPPATRFVVMALVAPRLSRLTDSDEDPEEGFVKRFLQRRVAYDFTVRPKNTHSACLLSEDTTSLDLAVGGLKKRADMTAAGRDALLRSKVDPESLDYGGVKWEHSRIRNALRHLDEVRYKTRKGSRLRGLGSLSAPNKELRKTRAASSALGDDTAWSSMTDNDKKRLDQIIGRLVCGLKLMSDHCAVRTKVELIKAGFVAESLLLATFIPQLDHNALTPERQACAYATSDMEVSIPPAVKTHARGVRRNTARVCLTNLFCDKVVAYLVRNPTSTSGLDDGEFKSLQTAIITPWLRRFTLAMMFYTRPEKSKYKIDGESDRYLFSAPVWAMAQHHLQKNIRISRGRVSEKTADFAGSDLGVSPLAKFLASVGRSTLKARYERSIHTSSRELDLLGVMRRRADDMLTLRKLVALDRSKKASDEFDEKVRSDVSRVSVLLVGRANAIVTRNRSTSVTAETDTRRLFGHVAAEFNAHVRERWHGVGQQPVATHGYLRGFLTDTFLEILQTVRAEESRTRCLGDTNDSMDDISNASIDTAVRVFTSWCSVVSPSDVSSSVFEKSFEDWKKKMRSVKDKIVSGNAGAAAKFRRGVQLCDYRCINDAVSMSGAALTPDDKLWACQLATTICGLTNTFVRPRDGSPFALDLKVENAHCSGYFRQHFAKIMYSALFTYRFDGSSEI